MSTSTTSFTAQLRETIVQSRSVIDMWVVSEMKRVDQHVQQAQKEVATKQHVIDTTSAQLLALQLQYGCTIGEAQLQQSSSDDQNHRNSSNNKLAQQQTELETKIDQQIKKNQRLETQLVDLKKQLQGMIQPSGTSRRRFTTLIASFTCFLSLPLIPHYTSLIRILNFTDKQLEESDCKARAVAAQQQISRFGLSKSRSRSFKVRSTIGIYYV
jgi:hypothetical protein